MKTQKRIRPLVGVGEIFRVPQVILVPAALISCALAPLIWWEGSLPNTTIIGAVFAAFIFGILTFFMLVVPAIYALILSQSGVEGIATIINKEKRARTLITPQYRGTQTDSYVTFEFTPQGASTPIRLEAEVGKLYSKLQEGKSAKIRYANSNPRILKFIGE
jgi:hypothetical protein